jgi:tRNA-splicing ligase RtcB (3'-phosphate/5'-hydroxy nucleic acid ligase)
MTPHAASKGLLVWSDTIEPEAIAQAERTSRLPFVQGHVALMPDAHWGLGACVGSVIPTQGAIIPAAVGVDIGCGMIAVETELAAAQLPDNLDALMPLIEERVPAGVGQGHTRRNSNAPEQWLAEHTPPSDLSHKQTETVLHQFGTLGSGNHFVEICLDERAQVWVVLHSGSRGIGNQLAKVHIDEAKHLAKQWFIPLEDPDLAYLVQGTPQFGAYISDMNWAQHYAFGNREEMMDAVLVSLAELVPVSDVTREDRAVALERRRINCHHNFTQMERHHGQNLWITRKGAIKADTGDEGVIPGSMGTRSYIVHGLGSEASYRSCSHGAGRRLSRRKAKDTLTAESLTAAMAGKTWNGDRASSLVDEHPEAYKDIDEVMADQSDLVEIEHTLSQIFNYKG